MFIYSILVHDNDACTQALLCIRVVTKLPKGHTSMRTNQSKEEAQLTPFASGDIWNNQIVSYFVWQMMSYTIGYIFKSGCVCETETECKKKKKTQTMMDTRTSSIKEAIIDKYQATIQNDLWGEPHKAWPGKQKNPKFLHSSLSSLLSLRSALPDTPFIHFYNTVILSFSSSHKHTCKCSPPCFTLAHTWLCVSAYNQPLLKDTHINQRQAHLLSMYGSQISPDAAYRLIVKSQTLLQGQNILRDPLGRVLLFFETRVSHCSVFARSLFPHYRYTCSCNPSYALRLV